MLHAHISQLLRLTQALTEGGGGALVDLAGPYAACVMCIYSGPALNTGK